jgi:ABC-type sugar transport system ATPase subunit
MQVVSSTRSHDASTAIAGLELNKRYGGVQALRDVSIEARSGEVLGIVGENGAGKSTLIKILSGLESPDSGVLMLGGKPVRFHNPRDAQNAGVRVVPQELSFCPDLNVTENLLAGQLPRQRRTIAIDWRSAHQEAASRLAALGIDKIDVRAPLAGLTVVERAFVQIARAIDGHARVLILDEPTAPMSAREVEQTFDVLTSLRQAGVAVVFVSHRLTEVFTLCDRAVALRNGKNAGDFEKDEMTGPKLVTAMTSGRPLDPLASHSASSPTGAPAVLSAHGVRSTTIEDATVEVRAGEILGVYGSLGSGREQLARALMGLIGSIDSLTVLGKQIARPSPRQLIKAGVGYVPAERRADGLVLELTVRENLTLAALHTATRRGVLHRASESAIAERWVEELEIAASSVEIPVGQLSGGSQQKVLLARWLASGSRVLVLEEPTRGVDIGAKAEIYEILHRHVEEGGAALIVSSDLEEMANVPHRLLVMRSGRVVAELESAGEEEIANLAMAA